MSGPHIEQLLCKCIKLEVVELFILFCILIKVKPVGQFSQEAQVDWVANFTLGSVQQESTVHK